MNRHERVVRAINFESPDKIPMWNINADQEEGDVLWYDLRLYQDASDTSPWHRGSKSEWGYDWHNLEDGTMGQPTEAVISDLSQAASYEFPKLNLEERFAGLDEFLAKSEGYYRLAMMVVNGFTAYTFLRGFENSMMDFGMRDGEALKLLKRLFEWEKRLMKACRDAGFDGYHLGDDWGTQKALIISPALWDEIFAPLYKDFIDYAHEIGMHVWFHSCGNITDIAERLHNAGADVLNIAQPNVVDIKKVGSALKGRQCFLIPLSYQTTSISGSEEEIFSEAERMHKLLSAEKGGFIGYVEEYYCMGMSDSNYNSCRKAFERLNK